MAREEMPQHPSAGVEKHPSELGVVQGWSGESEPHGPADRGHAATPPSRKNTASISDQRCLQVGGG